MESIQKKPYLPYKCILLYSYDDIGSKSLEYKAPLLAKDSSKKKVSIMMRVPLPIYMTNLRLLVKVTAKGTKNMEIV